MTDLAHLRKDYEKATLDERTVSASPFEQFADWFRQAQDVSGHEANAMTVATATPGGEPSARIVLLKAFNEQGFVFYTNFLSAKGGDLAMNARAALLFYWPEQERQIRIAGSVEKVSRSDAEAYFSRRPRLSQISAYASKQSSVIPDREALDHAARDVADQYAGQDVPAPEFWGGFRVVPETIEFWQGRTSRLHDRVRYRLDEGNWVIERLSP